MVNFNQELEKQGQESLSQIVSERLANVGEFFNDVMHNALDNIRSIDRRVAVGLSVGALSLGGMAGNAEAKIVVGEGIQGVNLGSTEAEVTSAIGQATNIENSGPGEPINWGYTTQPFFGDVVFSSEGQVTGMFTDSKKQRTNRNIGPGSSLESLKKAYPKIKCTSGQLGPKSEVCTINGKYLGKATETTFTYYFKNKGANEVDIDSL